MISTAMIGLESGSTTLQEDRQFACAIEPRGLEQFVRDADHELAHHEDPERFGRAREDDAPVAVQQPQIRHDQEQRHNDDLDRDHQGAEHPDEQDVAARKTELGEGIAAQQVETTVITTAAMAMTREFHVQSGTACGSTRR